MVGSQKKIILSVVAIIAVVLTGYFLAYRLSFVGDDWIFYEIAGRLSWQEYLVKYFDPRAQTAWYRPLQGILFRFAYEIFRTDQVGYHVGNVLFHLASALLLFAVVIRATAWRKWSVGLVAALLYASFPTAVEGVFKPGVVDPLTTVCFLSAVWFWLGYLRKNTSHDYWLALGGFVLALSSKEIALFTPVTFFLIDRFVVGAPMTLKQLIKRYLWFGVVILGYIPIEYTVVSRSVFVRREGYVPGLQVVSNLLDYSSSLVFPWGLPLPFNYVLLAVAVFVLAYLIFVKKIFVLLPIVASALFAILPIVSFPFVTNRFLYLSLTSTALLYALGIDWFAQKFSTQWMERALGVGVASVVVIGGLGISEAAVGFAEFARVSRVPFRNVSQAHPSFPPDTMIYFVDPPLPGPNLSGMFFWRFGNSVTVGADDSGSRVGLRDHANTWVYIFDEQGNQKELTVEKDNQAQVSPSLPLRFSAPIQLEAYELVSTRVKASDAVVLFLYWRGLGHIEKDYTVSVQLIDVNGKRVAGYDKEPRRGKAPTSTWSASEIIIDAIQISAVVPPGTYRLAIGLYDAGTSIYLPVLAADGKDWGNRVIIEPVNIVE